MTNEQSAFDEFRNQYSKEEDCVQALFDIKWPDGFHCPRCEHPHAYLISTRRLPLYECRSCSAQISLTTGTIMERTRTPLRLWFQAIYLHARPFSINSLQLSTTIGVTYKTAWLICHKIRHAMSVAESRELLTGIVSVSDGIYCKRLTPYFDWHKQEQSLLIASSENENGEITRIKVAKMPKKILTDKYEGPDPTTFLREHVDPEAAAKVVVTPRYGKKMNTTLAWKSYHITFWLASIFRGIGPKHLQVYLNQYCYLKNLAQLNQPMFNNLLMECMSTQTITLPALTNPLSTSRSVKRIRATSVSRALPKTNSL
jgi:transposase-like protein